MVKLIAKYLKKKYSIPEDEFYAFIKKEKKEPKKDAFEVFTNECNQLIERGTVKND